jgi:hypothetical protein
VADLPDDLTVKEGLQRYEASPDVEFGRRRTIHSPPSPP